MILFLKILGGLAAVALGMYLGTGRYAQTQDEISARLGTGRRRNAKRHFMWLNYLKVGKRGSDRRREDRSRRFRTVVARDPQENDPKDDS